MRFEIKAGYKLGYINYPEEETLLKELIGAYSLNFRATLKSLKRVKEQGIEVTPKECLEIASRVYLLNPRIIENLEKQYPQVDEYIIKRAAVRNPSDPEKFLKDYLDKKQEQKE